MIPGDLIDRARTVRIEDECERHEIRLTGRIDRAGACPRCGGHDRFSINTRKQVFLCRGCGVSGDVIALLQHLDGLDFREAVETLSGERVATTKPRPALPVVAREQQKDDAERTAAALRLLRAAIDPHKTPVAQYLSSRGIKLGDDIANEVIRWHAGIGAMVVAFRDIKTDEPRAISRTFLDCEGRKLERKFLGPVGGAAIKLDGDEEVLGGLHLGEGIETCMAARQLGLRPTWALGSAGAIAAFPVLAGIETLTLLAEHDEASAKAVEACARRWYEAGREVIINEPTVGKDLNDALQRRASQ